MFCTQVCVLGFHVFFQLFCYNSLSLGSGPSYRYSFSVDTCKYNLFVCFLLHESGNPVLVKVVVNFYMSEWA